MLRLNELDLTFVDSTIERLGSGQAEALEILHAIQGEYGFLPQAALERICQLSEITPSQITGVSSFYDHFRHQPAGRHIIRVCVGTACHIKGADSIYDAFGRHLGIGADEDTDAQGLFTLEKVACLGCCTLAPAVQIDQITYGHLAPDRVAEVLEDFLFYQQEQAKHSGQADKGPIDGEDFRGEIRLGLDSCCVARGCGRVYQALQEALAETAVPVSVKRVGCVGMCYQTPLLEVITPDKKSHLYARVQPQDTKSIVTKHFPVRGIRRRISQASSRALESLLTGQPRSDIARYSVDVRDEQIADFLGKQEYIATEHLGCIDPVDIDEYLENGGFTALRKCLSKLGPEEIISEIKRSGLRGRGGAGYPTHMKWQAVQQKQSEKKYVVCNGDEGDPGAFMDRMLMESFPYRIIEGIVIAAYAVGAEEGRLYIRAEYPLALELIRRAIDECQQRGFIGNDILASGFSLHLKITPGAGAFVCCEETALLASIEGRRGVPRMRPPYPAEMGLWGKPTLVSNVETYAAVPWIVRNGAEGFAKLGTGKSKGTKVFALAGKVARVGLIEVPMGISIREIIEDIGGGTGEEKSFKAIQIGGPSGGCVPAHLAEVRVDYESLAEVGAMMGSGGLVVLDESDCMVDIARYFLQFTQNQSCGKCTFCRIGTRRMLDILDRLCAGQGSEADLEELEYLGQMVKKASLCGLGKTAPNPVLSTLKYFRYEYEAHLEKRCPAGTCKALITYSITDECIGCTLCAQHCPVLAIDMNPYQKHEIDQEKCVRCGTCKNICPAEAVKVE